MFQKDSSGEYIQERMANGQIQRYRKHRVLGKGGFAKCYEVIEEKTGKRFACKAIEKQSIAHSKLKQKLKSEIEIHRRLFHKNIVKFQSVFQDEKFIYILLELCSNNTLNQLLKRRKVLSQLQTRYYLQQILEALKYLHKHKIIHRDLKLDNFFIGQNLQIKVGDFGLAAIGKHPRKTICGTPSYIAPQILDSANGYSYQVDVWSIGIAAYLMLYGRYPFDASDSKSIAAKISSKTYLINPSIGEQAKTFIGKMLQIKPYDRSTVKQLLQHEFFTHFEIPLIIPRSSLACPLSSAFLEQHKSKKVLKLQLPKEDEEFNFMLESKESPSSPRFKPSNVSISMSASKILQLSKNQNLPYVFSQKKVRSFHFQQSSGEKDFCMQPWISRWWQFPKYGFFYQTTDNTFGARFNDASNIKSLSFPLQFTFIPSSKSNKKVVINASKIKNLSKQLISKMKAFHQMKQNVGINLDQSQDQGIYVKMYVRSSELFIIWLSNGNIQCRFQDKSQLIVSPQHTLYISADKIRVIFQSKLLLNQNMDIIKRQRQLAAAIKRTSTIKYQFPSKKDQAELSLMS